MRKNRVRAACYGGTTSYGAWVSITDPIVAQLLARAGFEWLLLDMEHGPITMSGLPGLVNAVRAMDAEPFVRAAWNTSAAIQVALDCGASGIMIPMINSENDARRAVADVRFSPLGERSRGGSRAAIAFQTDNPTYFREANDEVLLMAQIETAASIANLNEIAAVPGVDCLFVGPNDLAASYGFEYAAAWKAFTGVYAAAIEAVPVIARHHGKIPGILAATPEMAKQCVAFGYTLVGVGSDTSMLVDAARRYHDGAAKPYIRAGRDSASPFGYMRPMTAEDDFDQAAADEVVGDVGDQPVTPGELNEEDETTGGEH